MTFDRPPSTRQLLAYKKRTYAFGKARGALQGPIDEQPKSDWE